MARSGSTRQSRRDTRSKEVPPSNTGNKPVHTIRYKNLKAAIWQNTNASGSFYAVTLTRSYQDEQQQWHDTGSFNEGDLPTLAKAVNDAHSWIAFQKRKADAKSGGLK